MEELKGILDTVKRSPSRGSQDSASSPQPKKDSELELILRRRRNKAGESGDEREGQLNHVSSCDSLNGRRASSDSTRDSETSSSSGGLGVPSEHASGTGPAVSPDRRGSGPGPIVPRRKSSDCGGQRRESCSSVSESPVTNGARHSGAEADQVSAEVQTNGTNGVDLSGETEDGLRDSPGTVQGSDC